MIVLSEFWFRFKITGNYFLQEKNLVWPRKLGHELWCYLWNYGNLSSGHFVTEVFPSIWGKSNSTTYGMPCRSIIQGKHKYDRQVLGYPPLGGACLCNIWWNITVCGSLTQEQPPLYLEVGKQMRNMTNAEKSNRRVQSTNDSTQNMTPCTFDRGHMMTGL